MTQPPAVSAVADRMAGMFYVAQEDIQSQLATIGEGRRAARLRELRDSLWSQLDALEAETRSWLTNDMPGVYQAGAVAAASELGEAFVWSQPHLFAVQEIAARSWDDMLSATRFVRRDAKLWIRNEARQQATLSLLEGRTARQAGKALADAAGGELGLMTVTYRNGARVRLADYGDMAMRTVTGEAFAKGTLNQSKLMGVGVMECSDGANCGMNGHSDPEKPNTRLYPIDVAYGSTLSHPRCRRSWIPRVDVDPRDIASASSLRSEAQIRDQAASEKIGRPTRRTPRPTREPRATRTPRQPRAAKPIPQTPRYPGGLKQKDAERWMMDRWGVDAEGKKRAIFMDGLGDRSADAMASTMDTLMTKYPQTAKRVRVFGASPKVSEAVTQSTPYRLPKMGRQYADAANQVGALRLNATKAKKYDETVAMLRQDVKSGFHPPGTDSVQSVVTHEYGHHLLWNAQGAAGRSTVDNAIEAVIDRHLGMERASSSTYFKARYELIRSQIGRYATKSVDELIAESFAATEAGTASPLASELAQTVLSYGEW